MKFNTLSFVVSTAVTKDSQPQNTTVTLTECDIPDETIVSALTSGQSPRVRLQTKFRADGIPREVKMPWSDYVIPGRGPKVTVQETPAQIAERAAKDPALLEALLEQLKQQGAIE